jgi:cytidylate kinase
MIITIDGPAGTGKTTVAKKVAERLHFSYFDTGAMYRAVTWEVLNKNIDLHDSSRLQNLLENFSFRIKEEEKSKRYFLRDEDVTEAIRSQEVTAKVSEVAALLPVRQALLKIQHEFATQGDVVFEGRDIGSVVFPQAEVKIFLTAKPEVRAKRRLDEILRKNPHQAKDLNPEKMLQDLMRRDELDSSREHAPLICPKDAHVIDTSDLSIEDVVHQILEYKIKKEKKTFPKGNLLYRTILNLAKGFFKLLYRHRVYGQEHFLPGGAIIAANHASFFDPPIAAISSLEEVHFLAKESLFKIPLFGSLIRALNSHPVRGDAGDVAVFKQICALLKDGKKVILFPEGTRVEKDALEEIKPGVALLISRTGAFIQPLYIHGTYQVWNRFHKLPKLFGKTASVFGSPIFYESFAHLERREAQEAISQKLTETFTALRAWYETGAKGSPP